MHGQKKNGSIKIEFKDLTLEQSFNKLEKISDYIIFYDLNWLPKNKTSRKFIDKSIPFILDSLINNSTLSYYILDDNKIIITNNIVIYDKLPKQYFGEINAIKTTKESIAAPTILNKNTLKNQTIETIRLGKESATNKKAFYKLSGIISDKETRQPLANVGIFDRKNKNNTTTNLNGYFELTLPNGFNTLETSVLGYKNTLKNIIIFNDANFNFKLSSASEELSEVVLSFRTKQDIESTTTGKSTINSKESKNIPLVLGERDVLKIATLLPGVSTAGEGSLGFNVRGGKADQNLILLDDAVVYNPSHFFGIFQALNPFAIKEVNIYKGNIPIEFGGRISSVFDIESNKGNQENIKGQFSISPVTANALIEVPIEKNKSSLLLGARGAYSDWVLKLLNDSDLQNSKASFYDFIGNYHHTINAKNNLKATAYYSNDNFSITSDSLYNYSNKLLSFTWNKIINDNNKASLLLTNSNYNFSILFDKNSIDDFEQGYSINETEVKLKLNHLRNKHKFTYGFSNKLYRILPGEIKPLNNSLVNPESLQKEKGLESSIFISDEYTINDKNQIDVGIRYAIFNSLGPKTLRIYQDNIPKSDATVTNTIENRNNKIVKTYTAPEFRIGLRHLLNEDASLKLSFNNSIQFIHTLSNNTTVSPIDSWKLSDFYIKPQQAQQISLGYYRNFKEDMYEFSVETFFKKQQNIIDFKTGSQLLMNEFVETEVLQGDGKAYGIEFLLKKKIGKLSGWLSYTYSRALFRFQSQYFEEEINNGNFFPSNFDKPHDASIVLNYKFSQRLSFSSNFVYQTGRPVTLPVGNFEFNNSEFVLYSNRNQIRIPDFYRLDVGLNLEGNHKKNKTIHSFWSLSIYNILGRNNPYSVFFQNENGSIKALQSSIFAIPVPSLSYNISF